MCKLLTLNVTNIKVVVPIMIGETACQQHTDTRNIEVQCEQLKDLRSQQHLYRSEKDYK